MKRFKGPIVASLLTALLIAISFAVVKGLVHFFGLPYPNDGRSTLNVSVAMTLLVIFVVQLAIDFDRARDRSIPALFTFGFITMMAVVTLAATRVPHIPHPWTFDNAFALQLAYWAGYTVYVPWVVRLIRYGIDPRSHLFFPRPANPASDAIDDLCRAIREATQGDAAKIARRYGHEYPSGQGVAEAIAREIEMLESPWPERDDA